MSKAKAPKPNPPAAPSAGGNQPSQVGAGTQPAGGSSPPAGSAPGADETPNTSEPSEPGKAGAVPPSGEPPAAPARKARKPKLHPKAAAAEIPAAVLTAACGDAEFTDVLSARQYPDRWVLVLMSANHVRKVEVPNAP